MVIRRHRSKLNHEPLECRLMLAATRIFEPHQIDLTSRDSFGFQARSAYAADLDGDGDLDVISSSRTQGMVMWHENIDGRGTFSQRRNYIAISGNEADFILAADLDGDGDPDLLYASSREDKIAGHENLDAGRFGDPIVISSEVDSPLGIAVADLDGDGDLDVLSASSGDNTVAWYENTDGAGTFGLRHLITDQADGAWSVHAADLDDDGDLDILSASARDDTIAWYENQDGRGNFSDRKLISTPNPTRSRAYFVTAADLDGDGDLDVLSASYIDEKVSWYENLDGEGTFGPEQVIMHGLFRRLFAPRIDSVYAADLDGDGDLDVVTVAEFDHVTYWAENLDGRGNFAAKQPIAPFSELVGGSIQIVDIDNDGAPDILAASDHEGIIAWHKNRLIGDSNNDGVFDTSDLVLVFQAGKYLDDVPGNSTFDEGDWNLDGDFTSSDLVLAFQAGTFMVSTAQSVTSVSAAVDWLFYNDVQKKLRLLGSSHRGHSSIAPRTA